MVATTDNEREAQLREGREIATRETLGLKLGATSPRRSALSYPSGKPRPTLKGHDALVKGIQAAGAETRIILTPHDSDFFPAELTGKIVQSDRYTITLRCASSTHELETTEDWVIYKQAIICFRVAKPKPAEGMH